MSARVKLVSIRASPLCELARWVLERRGTLYVEQCNAPLLHVLFTKSKGGSLNVPVIRTPEKTYDLVSFLLVSEKQSRLEDRLFPVNQQANKEVEDFVRFVVDDLVLSVRLFTYACILPNRRLAASLMTDGVPWWEKAWVYGFYPLQAWGMRRALGIDPKSVKEARAHILEAFDRLSNQIQGKGGYLVGGALTMADIAFAAVVGPLTLPPEYGAALPGRADCPTALGELVDELRLTTAGQHALNIYKDERRAKYNASDFSPSVIAGFGDQVRWWLQRTFTNPGLLRLVFSLIRRFKPVWTVGLQTFIAKHADLSEAMEHDQDLTIKEVNAQHMDRLFVPFILGMDRSPTYDREKAAIMDVVKPGDLDWIRSLVQGSADELIQAARPGNRIDALTHFSRPIAARVVKDYFGVPGPSEGVLKEWMRSLFWEIFQNPGEDVCVHKASDASAAALKEYLENLIAAKQNSTADDLLSRLVRAGTLDADGIRRNISGIIIGAIDTTTTAMIHCLDQLLTHEEWRVAALKAANAGDEDLLRQCCYEALRFRPQTPVLDRHAENSLTLTSGATIRAGQNVLVFTLSAMFDPAAFPDPNSFKTDRPLQNYLHFGHALHTCYGRLVNGVQIPQQVGALLRAGARTVEPIQYEGTFPDRYVVELSS